MIRLRNVLRRPSPNRDVHRRHYIDAEPMEEIWPAASSPSLLIAERYIIPALDLRAGYASVSFVSKTSLSRTKTVFVLQIYTGAGRAYYLF
jgi:hypothetical protein